MPPGHVQAGDEVRYMPTDGDKTPRKAIVTSVYGESTVDNDEHGPVSLDVYQPSYGQELVHHVPDAVFDRWGDKRPHTWHWPEGVGKMPEGVGQMLLDAFADLKAKGIEDIPQQLVESLSLQLPPYIMLWLNRSESIAPIAAPTDVPSMRAYIEAQCNWLLSRALVPPDAKVQIRKQQAFWRGASDAAVQQLLNS